MDVSIIIVNYNTSSLIKNLLFSIFKHTRGIDFEIIVVDNNPNEEVLCDLRDYIDNIQYIPLNENKGFGKANNEGAKVAKGRNLLFLNPDTLLYENSIKIMSDFLDENPSVGVCGANIYDADKKPTHSFKRLFPGFLMELDAACRNSLLPLIYGKNVEFNTTNKPLSVAYICGADLMIKRNVWSEVGGFDKDIFMYYEDSLLCYQVRNLGFNVVSLPSTGIIHLEGKSFSLNEKREQVIFTGRYIFFSKVYTKAYHKLVNMMNRYLLALAMFVSKLSKNKQEYRKFSFRYQLYKNHKL